MNNQNQSKGFLQSPLKMIVIAVLAVASLVLTFNLGENLDNKEVMVVQTLSGNLNVFTTPGPHWQGFGHVTKYKKSFQYWFDGKHDEGGSPIPIKFNDGGHADIPGSIRVDFPLDEKSIIRVHTKYGSQAAIESQLIGPVLIKSIYMAGPTMTSQESYAAKKNDLLYYVEDQASNGVYKTAQKEIEITDTLTKESHTATVVEIVKDSTGQPRRMESSLVTEMGIKLSNLSFGDFGYDDIVKNQIKTKQAALAQVQTAMAEAKKAEQQSYTTKKQGEADAAKAEWEQKTANAKIIAEAEGRKLAADQDMQAAEFERQAQVKRAQGDAEAMRLRTAANNNFDAKIEAYKYTVHENAAALASFKGNIVPFSVSGGSGNGSSNAFNDFLTMQNMKAAKELGIDVSGK